MGSVAHLLWWPSVEVDKDVGDCLVGGGCLMGLYWLLGVKTRKYGLMLRLTKTMYYHPFNWGGRTQFLPYSSQWRRLWGALKLFCSKDFSGFCFLFKFFTFQLLNMKKTAILNACKFDLWQVEANRKVGCLRLLKNEGKRKLWKVGQKTLSMVLNLLKAFWTGLN